MNSVDLEGHARPSRRFVPAPSRFFGKVIMLFAVLWLAGGPAPAIGERQDKGNDNNHGQRFCARTAGVAFKACYNEASDDFWIAVGNCINLSDGDARSDCRDEGRGGLW